MIQDSDPIRGIVVFDLDGTLLRGETVCEILAKPLGRTEEMAYFEALSSESEIAEGRATMAEWFDGHPKAELQAHLSEAAWAPGAQDAVRILQKAGVVVGIASFTWEFAVEWFAKQLAIEHWIGTALSSTGEVHHVWGREKAEWLEGLARKLNVPWERTAAVGDSGGDVEMLRAVAAPCFVGSTLPHEFPPAIHAPRADLREVAERILAGWV